ncbi:tRNA lysidine(34) synthetase TilS [Ferrimonas sediminicola]|uniref:tRNA(Ile)-lysidine synthase n=1 Tax=Ferrimonas sediminicola TaxID=2569538 RepID=A0A4V5NVB0_9GAMM|nr:tRNA lysidine(34) synthetase TilS [Ferrimonas sediminicola]TKB49759.1 tRNA lysidine(34) synthetase TilS [Ferrimonas sediminicola]
MSLTQLESSVRAALVAHLDSARRVVLGYSGGIDSELLASILSRLRPEFPSRPFLLIHVNHGLSASADEWAEHCRRRAELYGLPLTVTRVEVELGPRISLEAAAREARYAALNRLLLPGDLLLTAQHKDDQAETLLLALKRGSGPLGLAGMLGVQPFAGATLLRPLLGHSRREVETAAAELGLAHIEDDSNADLRFDRNFLRHEILPLLKARWPSFHHSVHRSAQLCGEQQSLCDELAAEDLTQHQVAGGGLGISGLADLSAPRRNNLVRYWLRKHNQLMPSQAQLQQLEQFWLAREDAQPTLKLGESQLRRFRDALFLVNQAPSLADEVEMMIPGVRQQMANGELWCLEERLQGERLRAPRAGESVLVRYDLLGTRRVRPANRSGSRPLKKVWQELGVPPWLRGQIPMLFFGNQLVAALGYWLEQEALEPLGPGLVPIRQE